ncbi:hypothetical protein EUGRSUZ_H02434 [Eucalyptus grandis]|uniref:Alcohol dehydrogenase-like C-terminal domain-containing protein n=2 Tax=Eucalyptus grandis TaxID=71139 RepID=A0A059B0A7_EUCGR|nr:hypothetical protein EUGRSUZ_H02434 [Eucalyptus grandis]
MKASGRAIRDSSGHLSPFQFSRRDNLENCGPKMIMTYSAKYYDGTTTYGGYLVIMVSNEHLVIKILDNLPLDGGAPLLCDGITVYNPLTYYGLDKAEMHLEMVGLCGLGHMAIKFAKAMMSLKFAMGIMNGIIGTISIMHTLLPLISFLKTHGKLVMAGAPEKLLELLTFPLLMGQNIMGRSCVGGVKEMKEMIDFASKHNKITDIELIPMDYVNTAMQHLLKIDFK